MTRRLRHIVLARLVLALGFLALCGDMAAPALAGVLRAGATMPCHERTADPASLAQAGPHDGSRALTAIHAGTASHSDTPAPARHLCCVLACLVMAPAVERADPAPMSRPGEWPGRAFRPLAGRAPPVLVPPPRQFS